MKQFYVFIHFLAYKLTEIYEANWCLNAIIIVCFLFDILLFYIFIYIIGFVFFIWNKSVYIIL